MENISKPTSKRVAVVTGANKGIGLEIARKLAMNGVVVVLTARDEKRGAQAVQKLRESGIEDELVVFHQLDVANPAHASSLFEFIKMRFEKLDILVNNAGVGGNIKPNPKDLEPSIPSIEDNFNFETQVAILLKSFAASKETVEKAEECINSNYFGNKRVTQVLLPLLQLSESPRIVNVTSVLGILQNIPDAGLRKELSGIDSLTEKRLDELVVNFLRDFREGKTKENGWPTSMAAYKVSKAALSAYTRMLAKRFPTFLVNCVHPGFVKTDLTGRIGTLTAEEGARGPVMLALLPEDGPSGCYYDEMQLASF